MTTHQSNGNHDDHDDDRVSDRIIRTQADLEAVWRELVEPLGFAEGSLWVMPIGPDDRPTKALLQIQDDLDGPPGPGDVAALGEVLRMVGEDSEPGTRWALLRCRPGGGGIRPDDRALVGALLASCREAGVPTEVAHLATDETVVPVPYDELARSA